jgi:hypothetical protein
VVSAFPLEASDRNTLLEALGFDLIDPVSQRNGTLALLDVELWLGAYPALVDNVQNAPRATEYVAALDPIRDAATNLLNSVKRLNVYGRDALVLEGIDIPTVEQTLAGLADAARESVARCQYAESRGRRKREALSTVISGLCTVFEKHSSTPRENRVKSGNQSNLTEWEAERDQFIRTALDVARIPYPRNLSPIIRRTTACS